MENWLHIFYFSDAELIFYYQRFELVESFMVKNSKGALIYLTKGLIKKFGTKHQMDGQDGSIDIPHTNHLYSELFGYQNQFLKYLIDLIHQAQRDA